MTVKQIIEQVITWLTTIALDNTHGYSQQNRWGKDYDCSSLIISAFDCCNVPVKKNGATYTGNMLNAFLKSGFIKVPIADRMRGDVLLAHNDKTGKGHTAMYIGDNQIIHASNDYDKKPGDSSGKEICIRPYYSYPWNYCLRYVGIRYEIVDLETTLITNGVNCPAVKSLQILLNAELNINLVLDGECGSKTVEAIKQFQKKYNLTVDGECGKNTWGVLINGR